jgi:hypothetical protein
VIGEEHRDCGAEKGHDLGRNAEAHFECGKREEMQKLERNVEVGEGCRQGM